MLDQYKSLNEISYNVAKRNTAFTTPIDERISESLSSRSDNPMHDLLDSVKEKTLQ